MAKKRGSLQPILEKNPNKWDMWWQVYKEKATKCQQAWREERVWGAKHGGGYGAHVASGTYPDNNLSKSKLFLSSPENQHPLLPYLGQRNYPSVNWHWWGTSALNTEERQSHTMRQSFSLGHYSPAGEKIHNIRFFVFIPVLYGEMPRADAQQCNRQAGEQDIRMLYAVFGSYTEHNVPVPFALFSQLPRAGPLSC